MVTSKIKHVRSDLKEHQQKEKLTKTIRKIAKESYELSTQNPFKK